MMVKRSRGETDITAVFGTAIPGSNPGGSKRQILCADTGNRTPISTLARWRSTTKPYPLLLFHEN